jgi:hypothetical protein
MRIRSKSMGLAKIAVIGGRFLNLDIAGGDGGAA